MHPGGQHKFDPGVAAGVDGGCQSDTDIGAKDFEEIAVQQDAGQSGCQLADFAHEEVEFADGTVRCHELVACVQWDVWGFHDVGHSGQNSDRLEPWLAKAA